MAGVVIQVADGQNVISESTVMVGYAAAAARLQMSDRGVEERILDMVVQHGIQQNNAGIIMPGKRHCESRKDGISALCDIGAQAV
jgi:hypothetical protein